MKKEGRTLKQEQELFMIGAVLNGKRIPTENCISSDRPDIIIPTEDKKAIGVEVVTYRATNNAENETALYKILVEYGKKVDKEGGEKYYLTVLFHGAELPANVNFKEIKETLFKELDNCRLDKPERIYNEYISKVSKCLIPGLDETFVGLSSAFFYDNVNDKLLENVISKKSKKLKQYKTLNREFDITEWWLVIYFPTIEHTDFSKYERASKLCTGYDHVYLAESGNLYKELK